MLEPATRTEASAGQHLPAEMWAVQVAHVDFYPALFTGLLSAIASEL